MSTIRFKFSKQRNFLLSQFGDFGTQSIDFSAQGGIMFAGCGKSGARLLKCKALNRNSYRFHAVTNPKVCDKLIGLLAYLRETDLPFGVFAVRLKRTAKTPIASYG